MKRNAIPAMGAGLTLTAPNKQQFHRTPTSEKASCDRGGSGQ